MKKYLFILKSEVMSNLQYVFDVVGGFVGYFFMMLIFLNLWQYIYSDPSEIINGYSMNQMIWYVIITEILYCAIKGRVIVSKISHDVKDGNIAYNINKPYNYIMYSLFGQFGSCLLKFIVYFIFGLFVGFLFLKSFPALNILNLLAVIFSMVLASIISIFISVFIGLLSFFIEDANPFYWIYSKLILIFGTLFPIEYFPNVLQKILNLSPIYVTSYGPARLFVNFSWNEFLTITLAQIIYILLSYFMCLFIYRKGVKRINVNGG